MTTIWNVKQAVQVALEIDGEWSRLPLNEVLRRLRVRRAMTQSELAQLSGFSQSALSDLETGRTDPPWSTARQVLFAMDCAPLILLRPLNEWPKRHAQWRGCEHPVP